MQEKKKKIIVVSVILFFILVISIIFLVYIKQANLKHYSVKKSVENIKVAENVWIEINNKKIEKGDDFDLDIVINTNNLELGAFAMELSLFNNKDFTVDLKKGNNGVSGGDNSNNFIIVSNFQKYNFKFSGICAQNCAKGEAVHIATIHLHALDNLKFSKIFTQLKVLELTTTLGTEFKLNKYQGAILIK